jgi:hypothetical protein
MKKMAIALAARMNNRPIRGNRGPIRGNRRPIRGNYVNAWKNLPADLAQRSGVVLGCRGIATDAGINGCRSQGQ